MPREWERADGIWGKLRAHFGSGATWMDLLYLFAKLVFGTISFTLLVVAVSTVGWFLAIPFFALFDVPVVNGTWVSPALVRPSWRCRWASSCSSSPCTC